MVVRNRIRPGFAFQSARMTSRCPQKLIRGRGPGKTGQIRAKWRCWDGRRKSRQTTAGARMDAATTARTEFADGRTRKRKEELAC